MEAQTVERTDVARHESRWKFRHAQWIKEKRKPGKSGGHDLGDLEPWLDEIDKNAEYPLGGCCKSKGSWTLPMLQVLACLHRTERNYLVSWLQEAGDSTERLNTALAICKELKNHRTASARILNKLVLAGLAIQSGMEGRRKVFEITEMGVKILWTGVYKRGSRRSGFGDNPAFWTPMPQGFSGFEFDALAIVREMINARNMLIAGTSQPDFWLVNHIRKTKRGPQVYRRRTLYIDRPNHHMDEDGKLKPNKYCWKPYLTWWALRKMPLGLIQDLVLKTEAKLASGDVRNFFGYTFGVIFSGARIVNGRLVYDGVLQRQRRFDGLLKKFAHSSNIGRIQQIRESGGNIRQAITAAIGGHTPYQGPRTRRLVAG